MKHQIVKIKAGDFLYKEGDEKRSMYLLKQGRVKLLNIIEDQEIEGMTIFNGSVVGELSFFDGKPRESSAKSVMNSTLIAIEYEEMKDKLEAIPSWFTTIINAIVGRIRFTESQVIKNSLKGSSVDYGAKEKTEGIIAIDRIELLKLLTVLHMVSSRYGRMGVKVFEMNYDMLKKFVVRFGLGSAKLDALLKILVDNDMALMEDLGEGKTKLEIFNVDQIGNIVDNLRMQSDKKALSDDSVRILNALHMYFEDIPVAGDGMKSTTVVQVQDLVLGEEKHFIRKMAFKLLFDSGFINFDDEKELKEFNFDPIKVESFLPTQKILSAACQPSKE